MQHAEQSVYVPLSLLKQVVAGVRSHADEKRRLAEQIEENNRRVLLLKGKTFEVEQKLSQYKSDHRQSVVPQSNTKLMALAGAHKDGVLSGSMNASSATWLSHHHHQQPQSTTSSNALHLPLPNPLTHHLVIARERVGQLEEVMKLVKDISVNGEFHEVVAKILYTAQKLVRADKYSLGVLNERRNIVEIFSIKTGADGRGDAKGGFGQEECTDGSNNNINNNNSSNDGNNNDGGGTNKEQFFVSEGVLAADSPTTFGRVIITGNALDISDFYAHESYDAQLKSETGVSPHALLCLPIRNAHGAVVGVLQVVWMERPSAKPPAIDTAWTFTSTDRTSLEFITVVAGAALWNMILSRERQTAQSRIEGLLKLHRNISMEAVSSTVLDQVLSVCHELIGTERIGLFMKMEGEDELYITSAADIVRGEYVPITKGIVGHVARTGETVITNDAYSHSMFDPTLDQKTGFVTRRILCLPVKSPDGSILAVISAVNKVDNTDFTSEDAVFLNYAADAVGISLHKSSLHHEVKTSQKLIEARLQLTTFISESSDIAEFTDLVMEIGKDIMECDRFGLLLIDHFKKELWITPQVGGESIRTPMNRGISGLVATTGQTVCTRDAYKHEWFDPSVDHKTGYRTTSVLCMPIFEDHALSNPKVVAVAMCINKKEGNHVVAFNRSDRSTMERYCREVQFALGRLSLDISYYKVVSDCIAVSATGEPHATGTHFHEQVDSYSETDIISSIVHKYCHSDSKATGAPESGSLASVVPTLIKRKQEDDLIPFPREIVFANGMEETLDQWNTDTLPMSSPDIGVHCGFVFRAYGFLEAFRISHEKFHAFTTNVANYYRSNRFHNFQHGFQVMLAMHIMIRSECRKFFSGIEIFSMLLAALCHDIDHPGNTNDFELKTLSAMALTHNDDAVLERHHCRVTFIILNHKSAKILQHLDEVRYKRVRQLIIYCILATDMSKHFEKCKALESLTRRQLSEKRSLLMGILIHAADLSYHALPFQQASDWGMRLLDEFQNQAKAEADQAVSTDYFMQNLDNRKTRLIVLINYINFVVRPIWLPLTSLCHHLRFYTESLEHNFEQYRVELDRAKDSEEQEAARSTSLAAAISVATTLTTIDEGQASPPYQSPVVSFKKL
ncbi:TPA: hypothetical protein N0F65_005793 [Lagenidium giganteum]|uniref:Phosphodiesterase n=1 Tax=Lagenidium giganteum TaxID=4803 RepID=A0AAV2YJB0_9STRA|nr:TPA: hypothetical protein N0F65_005793 [Lagenidium giganteum]